MKKAMLNIAFLCIILLLALPGFQMLSVLFREKPLNGAFTLAEKPAFSKKSWMDGSFQAEEENYLKDHTGFRNFLVRLQNQVDYSLFNQAHAEGVVIGKDGQLYEYDYIRSWLAIDYPGDSFAEKKLLRLKYIQEYLKKEKGIDLVLVFEPGKASFYPEYIPEEYALKKSGPSTYDYFRKKAEELKIDFIDFQQYFLDLKQKSEYPLFPCYGTHWSIYGMQFAADSLLNFIECRRGIRLTDVNVSSLQVSKTSRGTDDDVLKTMNTLFRRRNETLAYPQLAFDTLNPGYKPMVLAVADSYYWNIFNSDIPKYVFANQAYWYFNSLVYPDYYYKPTYTKDLDFQKEIEKQQVIFLMVTERFVYKFDWRFIDQIFDLYAEKWLKDPVYERINGIMQVESWFDDILKKSQEKHQSLEEALTNEAKYLYYKDTLLGYLIDYGPEQYEITISQDSAWNQYVIDEATKKNVSYNEMLRGNAEFVFKKDHPLQYDIYAGLNKIEIKLISDPDSLAKMHKLAASRYWDFKCYLRKKAWGIYKESEITKTRNAIMHDAKWLGDVKEKAMKNRISLDEMIRLDAIYVYNQKLKNAGLQPIIN
jgi:hypothetical protein